MHRRQLFYLLNHFRLCSPFPLLCRRYHRRYYWLAGPSQIFLLHPTYPLWIFHWHHLMPVLWGISKSVDLFSHGLLVISQKIFPRCQDQQVKQLSSNQSMAHSQNIHLFLQHRSMPVLWTTTDSEVVTLFNNRVATDSSKDNLFQPFRFHFHLNVPHRHRHLLLEADELIVRPIIRFGAFNLTFIAVRQCPDPLLSVSVRML